MKREEHLKFCSICTKRKLNLQKGLLCSLTNEFASFETDCADFIKDEKEVERKFEMEMAAAGDGSTGDNKDYKTNKGIGLAVVIISVFWLIFVGLGLLPMLVLGFGIFMTARGIAQEKIYLKHKEENEGES